VDIVLEGSESCKRCGSVIYGFSKKRSASDGLYYCIKCAEYLDKKYLIENTCSVCARTFSRGEIKFVMPSKIYSMSPLPLAKRLVCVNCYKRFAIKNKMRVASIWRLRLGFRRGVVRNLSESVARVRN
jgi:protein-arginine kinase activator protein McsA